jgi:hypothetical protein
MNVRIRMLQRRPGNLGPYTEEPDVAGLKKHLASGKDRRPGDLREYIKLVEESGGSVDRKYRYSCKALNADYVAGRRFAEDYSKSPQGLTKESRQIAFPVRIYLDIDFVNCYLELLARTSSLLFYENCSCFVATSRALFLTTHLN